MALQDNWMGQWSDTLRQNFPIIRGMVAQGFGKTETYNVLKAGGVAGRKQDVLRMWQDIKDTTRDINSLVDQSNPMAKPIGELIPPSLGKQARSYSYLLEYEAVDPFSHVGTASMTTVSSDRLLSVDEIKEAATREINKYGFMESFELDSLEIKEIHYDNDPYLTPV